jgi:hypothetical protein
VQNSSEPKCPFCGKNDGSHSLQVLKFEISGRKELTFFTTMMESGAPPPVIISGLETLRGIDVNFDNPLEIRAFFQMLRSGFPSERIISGLKDFRKTTATAAASTNPGSVPPCA